MAPASCTFGWPEATATTPAYAGVGVDDNLVGLRAADEEPHIRVRLAAGLADLGLGLIAQFVGPVARIQMVVGFSHGFKHRGMGGAGVIVLKRQHDGPFVLMFGELDMP